MSYAPLPIIGVCGPSGSGKTLLIQRLVPRLMQRGLRVAVVKHCTHRIEADTPGKDTDRIFQAGADVLAAGPHESFARFHAANMPLAECVRRIADRCDLVLVEGSRDAAIPKIWLTQEAADAWGRPEECLLVLSGAPDACSAAERAVLQVMERARSGVDPGQARKELKMTPRERVLKALSFEPTDRVPRDLGGMRSTGISAFAYPKLRAAMGLPERPPRVHDFGQMLALPDLDVLDALGCDVITVEGGDVTNAFEQPELWRPYDFGGRLPALVRDPQGYRAEAGGTLVYRDYLRMPPDSYVFDSEHAGQLFVLDGELPKPDLKEVRKQQEARVLKDEQIARIRDLCRRARAATDRAIMLMGPLGLGMCIHGYGGLAVFPVLCLLEPDLVHEVHSLTLEAALKNVRALLPEIKDYVDVVGIDSDDWGNQNSLMAPPRVFRDLFLPYRKRHNAEIHRVAPHVKTFLHSCGALYEILDMIIESGTDILNPVQWSAGGRTPAEWKAKCRGRMTLWGGGVNAQRTLPLGSVADVEREVAATVAVLRQDGGYVFANVHNILAEIAPEKVIAMYRTAERA